MMNHNNGNGSQPEVEPGLMSLNEVIGILIFGKDLRQVKRDKQCMTCPCDANEFKDDISRKEYLQSGMCQHCQDKVFG
ncbi:hypothetical protein LCGC14_1056150 [marine sediment metagenome]|uniref:Uncharacterized protein n=1 Tax=marine sediment metagenome TaxID=412755 RepID=A0A0F9N9B3_9ZZZZ